MNTGNSKKIYTIGEVAELTGIKQSVLRFWEDEFSVLSPVKNKFGHRVYTLYDIDIINKIKKALYEDGLTIKGAKKLFSKTRGEKTDLIAEIRRELLDMLEILRS